MKPKLRGAFNDEMKAMNKAYLAGDLNQSFYHLERAHILGQRHFKTHLETHWWMLKIGFGRKDIREIFGQIIRMIAVFPTSLFGWVPVGNTGGANVSALKPMPIPHDLALFLEDD